MVAMPIQLSHPIKSTRKVIRFQALANVNEDLIVWWYSGIYKAHLAKSQPSALVGFRQLLSADYLSVSDKVIYRRVPLTALGQLRLGTLWRNGICQGTTVFEKNKFAVDFTKGKWKLTSFQKIIEDGGVPPYPPQIYPLKHQKDKNWLLEFPLPSGGKLIVPCLEFFTRCYGRSAELRRVLATYSWNDCCERRLYAPINEEEENEVWKVKLRKRLVNGDVILLAHAKYERYTENAVKQIYAQTEAMHDPNGAIPAFIKVAPWFQGPAELKVKGIPFDNGRSFLALEITGCSQPTGSKILLGRENSNGSVNSTGSDRTGKAWAGTQHRERTKPPKIIDLTDSEEPDSDALSTEIEDPEFEELGEPRVIIRMENNDSQSTSGVKSRSSTASKVSSGETHGTNKGVGYASIHAPSIMESQGMLRDMWTAMHYLMKKYPNHILSVEWYDFSKGFSSEREPYLISLNAFGDDEGIDGATRNWPYIDSNIRSELRGILVARISITGNVKIYIIEIQRRPRVKKDKNGDTEDSEESFKGLVFILNNESDLNDWLNFLLNEVRYVKGVVQKLTGKCPGNAATFKHSTSRSNEVRCEASVLHALEKMGILIPKDSKNRTEKNQ